MKEEGKPAKRRRKIASAVASIPESVLPTDHVPTVEEVMTIVHAEVPEVLDQMKDFRNFMFVIWQHLKLPQPTDVQYDIAEYLQNSPRKVVIEAFRGIGKSYITVAYVCWRLYLDPQIEIMVVSAGKERADSFSIFVKTLINDVPMLQHLIADKSKGQRDSNVAFDVGPKLPSGSPSVKSVGITGQLTGSRADLIVGDDIEIPSNSATPDLRFKLSELVKEFAAVIKPEGKIVYLGTPQTEMSLYNVLEGRGYQLRIWTAKYPTEEQLKGYSGRLAPFILDRLEFHQAGSPVDPMRFNEQYLVERELEYGRSGFALQFMLDTTLSDANKFPLKITDLIVAYCNPIQAPNQIYWSNNPLLKLKDLPNVAMAGQAYYSSDVLGSGYSPYDSSVMVIDPSGRGTDETGYAVAKMSSGNIYVPAAGGLQGGYSDETLIALCNIAKEHKVNKIMVESNFGDGMFTKLLTPHMNRIYPCTMEEVRQSTQKEVRIINALEPVLNQHRLVIDPSVIQKDYDTAMERYPADKAPQYMLFYQLTRLSKDRNALKHDDRLDALAMAVQFFSDRLSLDQQAAQDRRRQEMFDAELEIYRREMGGSSLHQPLNFHTRAVSNINKPHKQSVKNIGNPRR